MNKMYRNCLRLYVGIGPNPYSRDPSIDGSTGGITPLRGELSYGTKYRTALHGLMGMISVDLYQLNVRQKLTISFCILYFNLITFESTHFTQTMYCLINSTTKFSGNNYFKMIVDFVCTEIGCQYIPPPN